MLVGTCQGYKILSTNARPADVLDNVVSSHGGYGDEAATKAIMMLLPFMLQKLRRPIRLLLSETLHFHEDYQTSYLTDDLYVPRGTLPTRW